MAADVEGVIAADAAEARPVPTTFVAVTVNVYAVPFVSPVTTNGEAPPETVAPPGDAVTAYEVIAEPPLLTGATNPTVTSPLPRVPTTNVGAPGTVAGVTDADALEATPVPTAFVAVTVNV